MTARNEPGCAQHRFLHPQGIGAQVLQGNVHVLRRGSVIVHAWLRHSLPPQTASLAMRLLPEWLRSLCSRLPRLRQAFTLTMGITWSQGNLDTSRCVGFNHLSIES